MDEDTRKEISELTEITVENLTNMLVSEKLPEVMAKFLKNFYDNLVKVGFTKKQALALCQLPEFRK